MPIFRYQCARCGAEFKCLVAHFDSAVRCEACDSDDVKKLPSAFAAVTPSPASGCAQNESCPAAHCCNGGCCH